MWVLALFLLVAALGVLAMLAVGALAVFALAHALPWLLILFGIWLLLRATRRANCSHRAEVWGGHRSHRGQRVGPGPPTRAAPWTYPSAPQASARAKDVRREVGNREDVRAGARPSTPQPEARPRRELPIDVQVKVEQIRHKADVLLAHADRFPPFSHDLHLVRQTVADYLPRTVEAYLALPGDDDPVIPSAGKTALEELRGQLQLLDTKLDDITQNLQRGDLDRLLANRRFLEERFEQPAPDVPVEGTKKHSEAA
ncbi:MAG: hypothetical protein IT305_20470 [Chloroflexi bacterium]|nr:hypothetical protein [Chloroflexota bacterium]